MEEYANCPHDVNLRIFCVYPKKLPRLFFRVGCEKKKQTSQGFSSSHGGFGGLGFQQETCLVGQSLGGALESFFTRFDHRMCWLICWDFSKIEVILRMVHWKTECQFFGCFVQSVKYLWCWREAHRSTIWKEMKPLLSTAVMGIVH